MLMKTKSYKFEIYEFKLRMQNTDVSFNLRTELIKSFCLETVS